MVSDLYGFSVSDADLIVLLYNVFEFSKTMSYFPGRI